MSNGSLPGAVTPTASLTAGSLVTFNWGNNIGTGIAKASDKAFMVVYCAETGGCMYSIGNALRGGFTGSFDAHLFKGQILHTYMGFITADDKQAAPSAYTGIVLIPV